MEPEAVEVPAVKVELTAEEQHQQRGSVRTTGHHVAISPPTGLTYRPISLPPVSVPMGLPQTGGVPTGTSAGARALRPSPALRCGLGYLGIGGMSEATKLLFIYLSTSMIPHLTPL